MSRPSHFAHKYETTLMVNSEESLKDISDIIHMINLLGLAFCSIFTYCKAIVKQTA